MPPVPPSPQSQQPNKGGAGASIGVIIILVLLVAGALYLWSDRLNHKNAGPLPLIPGDSSSTL